MITGNKKDIAKLLPYVSERLGTALQYIAETDFTKVENGEYHLDGDKVFAKVERYTTVPKDSKKPESHNAYIDVQYLGEGTEKIYYVAKSPEHRVIEDYAKERDLLFYEDAKEKDNVTLGGGVFAIFFPWELHRPGCHALHAGCAVQKIVVKVLAEN